MAFAAALIAAPAASQVWEGFAPIANGRAILTGLYEEFDARPLDQAEKRSLQAALAWRGDYRGRLDGRWGPMAQRAIEAWAAREAGRAPLNLDAADLLRAFAAAAPVEGWAWVEPLEIAPPVALLLPEMRGAPDAGDPATWRSAEGAELTQRAVSLREAGLLYGEWVGGGAMPASGWEARRAGEGGRIAALRAETRGDIFVITQLVWHPEDAPYGELIRASIGVEGQPQIGVTEGGQIAAWIDAAPEAAPGGAQDAPPGGESTAPGPSSGSGSGFRIAPGFVLTSRHVIAACSNITVAGEPVSLESAGGGSELALLRVAGEDEGEATLRGGNTARLSPGRDEEGGGAEVAAGNTAGSAEGVARGGDTEGNAASAVGPGDATGGAVGGAGLDGATGSAARGTGQGDAMRMAEGGAGDDDTTVGVLPFAAEPARLNADITVAGFPLVGLLGGLNVTRGTVSAESGIMANTAQMQISAPIQPGSSGGPVVNEAGQVVGVVLAKLDDMLTAAEWGVIAQNVNFATRISEALPMLEEAGLRLPPATDPPPTSPEDLAERLRAATVLIACKGAATGPR
ncbi:MAG: serine protease [Paracoccus sp. (in: a-proteobacteria)]|nr:serine protease [Paracoccus sp. (in: a-proteobacteria)]